ncbi:hypothetical protein [Leyella stercorea]|uniref:hypothetical protein n=1 Tax=Leyella stercorea TaxID=363265 RepID=UPI00242D5184|nr:hypothetical protein [Leyella stercorea]
MKTKVAQEETPEAIESPKVTLKRKQPETPVVAEPKPTPTQPKTEQKPQTVSPTPQPEKKSNTGKVIGGLVAAAIIAGIFFFINNKESEGGKDSTQTEVIAQNTENQNEGYDAPAAENSNEDASAESNGVPANGSEAPGAENTDKSPANTTSSAKPAKANDNQVAEQPTKQNPATIAEPAQSKPASTETTKPSPSTSAPVSGDVEENARRVIRGDFGNGQERKDKLGSSYSEIQGKVNEMYRQGLVH